MIARPNWRSRCRKCEDTKVEDLQENAQIISFLRPIFGNVSEPEDGTVCQIQ